MIVNRLTFEVKVREQVLLLPLKEFELLSILCSKPDIVFTRDQLMEQVWGYDYDGDDFTLTTHIKRLRTGLEEVDAYVKIQTVRGIGCGIKLRKSNENIIQTIYYCYVDCHRCKSCHINIFPW